jgi:hypothetical protein
VVRRQAADAFEACDTMPSVASILTIAHNSSAQSI